MQAFVTVGSTRFDELIQCVFSEEVLLALRRQNYTRVVVQCGNSAFELASIIADGSEQRMERAGISIEFWKFKSSLEEEYDKADLIISHAGSGTILDVLRRRLRLIVVPNETLLDNHQEELASALAERGHLVSGTVKSLAQAIQDAHKEVFVPFPSVHKNRIAGLVDETLGFIDSAH